MTSMFRFAALPALLSTLSLVTTPATATELPIAPVRAETSAAVYVWDADQDGTSYHRGNRHYRHYRHDRGVDAGDVLAGVLIIGGIAAIASAASKNNDNDRYRDRADYPDDRRDTYRYDNDRGIDRAVTICADEIERDVRIGNIDAVNRTARGWQVTGSLYNGDGFTCSIGQDGRIEAIDYGNRGGGAYYVPSAQTAPLPQDDRQWNDDRYAAERQRMDRSASAEPYGSAPPYASGPQPAYPGGPIDGDEPVDGDLEIGTGYPGGA